MALMLFIALAPTFYSGTIGKEFYSDTVSIAGKIEKKFKIRKIFRKFFYYFDFSFVLMYEGASF
jgi:hypothetical protein